MHSLKPLLFYLKETFCQKSTFYNFSVKFLMNLYIYILPNLSLRYLALNLDSIYAI